MTDDTDEDAAKNGEVLPPDNGEQRPDEIGLNQTLLAVVSNYTDRPDLLIAEIEKHDPGFVKRMNEAAERDSAQLREARFKFGRFQAYSALAVSVVGALAMLAAVFFALYMKAGFGSILAIGIIYAITQGGTKGFSRLVEAISELIGKSKGDGPSEPKS